MDGGRGISLMETSEKVKGFLRETPEEKRRVLSKLREIIKKVAPEIDEDIKWGNLCFLKNGKIICAASVNKSYINLHFWYGSLLANPKKKILLGEGKKLRHLKIEKDIDKEAIADFVKQSVKLRG